MTNWFFSLGSAIQGEIDRKYRDISNQRRQYDQYIKRYYNNKPEEEWPKLKLKDPMNENETVVAQFEEFGFKD